MRVLVVDDDETFCRMLVEILEVMGMNATWTTSGLAGYAMVTGDDDYELCIIDVRMPLILGTDVAEAIREDCPDVKIILASAFADETLQEYARRKGMLLLSKPFTPSLLRATVELALGGSTGRN
jgi:CheY-like chemotaxis protein